MPRRPQLARRPIVAVIIILAVVARHRWPQRVQFRCKQRSSHVRCKPDLSLAGRALGAFCCGWSAGVAGSRQYAACCESRNCQTCPRQSFSRSESTWARLAAMCTLRHGDIRCCVVSRSQLGLNLMENGQFNHTRHKEHVETFCEKVCLSCSLLSQNTLRKVSPPAFVVATSVGFHIGYVLWLRHRGPPRNQKSLTARLCRVQGFCWLTLWSSSQDWAMSKRTSRQSLLAPCLFVS